MVQKISRPSPFIISVNYGINIAWEDRQIELRGKMGRNPAAMGSVTPSDQVPVRPL
jgi:hypothetical protein